MIHSLIYYLTLALSINKHPFQIIPQFKSLWAISTGAGKTGGKTGGYDVTSCLVLYSIRKVYDPRGCVDLWCGTEWLTHTCENITFLQLRLWAVKITHLTFYFRLHWLRSFHELKPDIQWLWSYNVFTSSRNNQTLDENNNTEGGS